MNSPLISIVLTLYNKADYIEDQIFSIYQQTYSSWELIIVDDCSTDGSFEKAKNFCEKLGIASQCIFLQNKENLRVAKTFEHGLQHVKGEYVAMADADDLWMRDKLEKCVNYLGEHPDIEFIYGDLTTIDGNNAVISQNFYKNSLLLYVANKTCPYPTAITSSILFSTKSLKELLKIGFPDKKWNIRQDYWISHFFVCWYGRKKIAYLNTPLAYYRRAPGAITLGQKKTKEWYKNTKHKIVELAIYILDTQAYNKENESFIFQMKLVNQKLERYIENKTSLLPVLWTLLKTGNFRWLYLVFQYFKDVR